MQTKLLLKLSHIISHKKTRIKTHLDENAYSISNRHNHSFYKINIAKMQKQYTDNKILRCLNLGI